MLRRHGGATTSTQVSAQPGDDQPPSAPSMSVVRVACRLATSRRLVEGHVAALGAEPRHPPTGSSSEHAF